MKPYKSLFENKYNIPLKKGTTKQTLYVDYSGGKFNSWFNSEGEKNKGKSDSKFSNIKQYALKNDFTNIVVTPEAYDRM